jgi:hypothetical protein
VAEPTRPAPDLADIEAARELLRGVIIETPVESSRLSSSWLPRRLESARAGSSGDSRATS